MMKLKFFGLLRELINEALAKLRRIVVFQEPQMKGRKQS